MKNSIAIHSTNITNDSLIIEKLKNFILKEYKTFDFFIFTDSLDSSSDRHYGVLLEFYMKCYKGSVVFLEFENYLQHKDTILGQSILYLDKDKIISQNIDKAMLVGCKIITQNNNELEWINNYGI